MIRMHGITIFEKRRGIKQNCRFLYKDKSILVRKFYIFDKYIFILN